MADQIEIKADYHWRDAEAPPSFYWNTPTFLSFCKHLKARRVLDLGCGNGALAGALAGAGFDVVGCDYDAHGIEIASKSYPAVRFVPISSYDPPSALGPLGFDVVISAEVIEHCFKPREVLKFARECLKPGGHLLISTPYHGYLKNLALSLLNKWDWHHMVWEDGGHIKFFSPKTLNELLQDEGFAVIEKRFVGRAPYLWKGMIFLAQWSPESIPAVLCRACKEPIPYPNTKAEMFARRDQLCLRCSAKLGRETSGR